MKRDWLTALVAIWLCCLAHAAGADASSTGPATDWSDSLVLLRNILKDLAKEKGLPEQYRLYLRAESAFVEISDHLEPQERQATAAKLKQVFQYLPPPPQIIVNEALKFRLITVKKSSVYWSDAVPQSLAIQFLNERKQAGDSGAQSLLADYPWLPYDAVAGTFTATDANAPTGGLNYSLAREFAQWLADRWHTPFALPELEMVKASHEPMVSCWSKTPWVEIDHRRQESWEMFGGKFWTLFLRGEPIGELPEAVYESVRLHLTTTEMSGKTIYLRQLAQRSP